MTGARKIRAGEKEIGSLLDSESLCSHCILAIALGSFPLNEKPAFCSIFYFTIKYLKLKRTTRHWQTRNPIKGGRTNCRTKFSDGTQLGHWLQMHLLVDELLYGCLQFSQHQRSDGSPKLVKQMRVDLAKFSLLLALEAPVERCEIDLIYGKTNSPGKG